ncbi:MAG: hypothetical protein ACXWE4_01585 [Methylobacter sp.]
MKRTHSIKNSAGIGLIEVLVTTVVVAVGLLAVASLQGDLISGSRSNKTRAEAQSLANTKIEQLRDSIQRTGTTGYNALASSPANESIGGVTETFTRSWVVTNLIFDKTSNTWVPATLNATTNSWDATTPTTGHTYGTDKKNINVTVCWSDGCTGNSQNQVTVQSVIAFDSVGNSSLTASGAGAGTAGTVGGPSTNANSSDDISENINLPTSATPGSVYTAPDGKTYIVQNTGTKGTRAYLCSDTTLALIPFENDLYTRRVDFDGVTGNEAILLYEKVTVGTDNYCIPRIRFNGGVIIPIRGMVHSGTHTGTGQNQTLLDVNLFTFNANQSGTYCVFNPQTGAKSAPYVCYVGGNCQFGPNGTTTAVTECPDPGVANAIVGPGGWRGKVGLLGIASNGNNVCFGEEIAAAPATLDTARNYFTRNAGLNEGINKPYNCHDFLIIDGKNTPAQVHSECVAEANAIGNFSLASKTIQRNISGNNVFDPTVDTSYCTSSPTSYTINGTNQITNAGGSPTVIVTDGAQTVTCTGVTSSSYTCAISTTATSVTISGSYNNQTVNCTLTPPSTTGCMLTFAVTPPPTYTINGHIRATSAAQANAVSLTVADTILNTTTACVNNHDFTVANGYSTYRCTLSTTSTTGVAINAVASSSYSVTPSSYSVPALSGSTSTITVPSTTNDFVATTVPTYTISGSITYGTQSGLGTNVTNITSLTAAVSAAGGSCTLSAPTGGSPTGTGNNHAGSYSCTVLGGANTLSIAFSPTCSNTTTGSGKSTVNAFKKYKIITTTGSTTTGLTSTGTGQLIINLGTVGSNQTYNIDISESATTC